MECTGLLSLSGPNDLVVLQCVTRQGQKGALHNEKTGGAASVFNMASRDLRDLQAGIGHALLCRYCQDKSFHKHGSLGHSTDVLLLKVHRLLNAAKLCRCCCLAVGEEPNNKTGTMEESLSTVTQSNTFMQSSRQSYGTKSKQIWKPYFYLLFLFSSYARFVQNRFWLRATVQHPQHFQPVRPSCLQQLLSRNSGSAGANDRNSAGH